MKFLSNRAYEDIEDTLLALRDALLDGQRLVNMQQEMLEAAARQIAMLGQANLDNLRTVQALAATVILVRANPEAEIEADIDAILREVSDKVAMIEEHLA